MQKHNLNEVIDLVADVFRVPKENLKSETKLVEDLGAKPVNIIRVIIALEDKYYIKIPVNEFKSSDTLGEITRQLSHLT